MNKFDPTKPTMIIDYLGEHDTKELYIWDYAVEIGIKVNENDPYKSFNYIDKEDLEPGGVFANCYAQGTFVSIKEMENFIAKAKLKGASHLDIHHHGDHGNYNLYAVTFRLATEKELKKIVKKEKQDSIDAIKELDNKIKQLEAEKKKLIG